MDIHLTGDQPTLEEKAAVDSELGEAGSTAGEGAGRVAYSGHESRSRRHLLLPVLHRVQARAGWISKGAVNYIGERLDIAPAEVHGVASFYGMFSLDAIGATLGSGVVMLFDTSVDRRRILARIAAFMRDESCGQCVPCRVGTIRQEEALHRLIEGHALGSVGAEVQLLREMGQAMRDASICGLGQTASSALESALNRWSLFS